MANKIRFRDYGDYCVYAKTEACKLSLALPKEILDVQCVKDEIKRLKLTTWQYSLNGSTREGTCYRNDAEKAWKYYERTELLGVLDRAGESKAAEVLENYLDNPDNLDDELPKFTSGEE